MRARAAVVAVGGLALLCVAIVVSGRHLNEAEVSFSPDDIADVDLPAEPEIPDAPAPQIDATTGLERIAPRPPLSDLSTPTPPKPPKSTPPERWQPTRVFNPVATAAGQVEGSGHRIVFAGVDPIAPDERCTFAGNQWPCGAQARTAFRSWLRGRAILCKLPPSPDRQVIAAECRVGNEDPAEWLIGNGWAKAAAAGPYAALGRQVQDTHKGVFGAPPKRVSVTIAPDQIQPEPREQPMPPTVPPEPSQ